MIDELDGFFTRTPVTFAVLADDGEKKVEASGGYQTSDLLCDCRVDLADNDPNGLFLVDSHAEKINGSVNLYNRRVSPGSYWVYHTSDTYVALTALDSYLKSKQARLG